MKTETAFAPQIQPPRQLCRAEPFGDARTFAHCLLKEPNCPYARDAGTKWLCCHPQRHRIIEHTQKYGEAGYQGPIDIEVGSIDD